MLQALLTASLRNRFVVLLATGILVVVGVQAARRLPMDAFPDTTPVQVQVNTTATAMAPEEVERLITFPIETALGGLKGLEEIRSISKFGLSQVVLVFSDATNVYFARQQINERLGEVELPVGIARPAMGPDATGLGEVYHFLLRSTNPEVGLIELRTLLDWVIRPRLRKVAGVAEINTWGGEARQFEVRVEPSRLAMHRLTLDDVIRALETNNRNVGGGYVVRSGESSLVQGVGRTRTSEEIGAVVVAAKQGVPVRIRDVAEVAVGHAIRRGGVTADGRGEVVLGLGFMRVGENSRDVSLALDAAIDELRRSLPRGVEVVPVYRRSDLVDQVLHTVGKNLFEGALLVVAVLFAFLGNLRAGVIVASAIPVSMLFAVTMMERIGIAGSLMSLGAIDFGLIVDSSVVQVENCMSRLARGSEAGAERRSRLQTVRDAVLEVRRPTIFGELIIMVVYLPILTLQGVEGKLFRPMALTVIFALLGSMIVSLTLMPVLASYVLPRHPSERRTLVDRLAHALFQPILGLGLRYPRTTLALVAGISAGALVLGGRLGSEFVPRLNEGSIVINTVRLASVSLEDSIAYGTRIERLLLKEFPDEIERIWTRTGTAEVATDPMGFEVSDVYVMLRPRGQWTQAKDQEGLVERMSATMSKLPGMRAVFSQPIELRLNEMVAGIRADVGVMLYGPDLDVLRDRAAAIAEVLERVPGAADVAAEQITGLPVLRVEVDRQALARHGVSAEQVLAAVGALGGLAVGEVIEPDRRFPLVVRLPEAYRDDPSALERILIPTASGERLPLTRLARIETVEGPSTIPRRWGERRIAIQANVRGRDLASFVSAAQAAVGSSVELGPDYRLEWGGQFDHLIRAERRLLLVIPASLALVLSLLYLTFHSVRDALMIFSGVLFARVGGVFGLWLMGLPFTISAGVGFIALMGASMLEGLVLVSDIRRRIGLGTPKRQAIEEARLARLRPVLMTGLVAAIGFAPMMLSTGIGAEVQRPLATVVFWGMVCDTALTLLALPCLYLLFGRGPRTRRNRSRGRLATVGAVVGGDEGAGA
jgi:cobalt-zinc-cadmium resistance protein CzcA